MTNVDRILQPSSFNSFPYNQMPPCNNTLTATQIDPFENPPLVPSHKPLIDSHTNRSKSTEPFSYTGGGFASDYQQSKFINRCYISGYLEKAAPSRPPLPKQLSNSWSNPSLSSPETLTNRAHAIAKYPYRAAHQDELSFDPKDTLLLEKEVDDQWVSAFNTRTGLSGIAPLSFLDIKIPLAPGSVMPSTRRQPFPAEPSSWNNTVPSSTEANAWGRKQVMKALYDYTSNVEGDLNVSEHIWMLYSSIISFSSTPET